MLSRSRRAWPRSAPCCLDSTRGRRVVAPDDVYTGVGSWLRDAEHRLGWIVTRVAGRRHGRLDRRVDGRRPGVARIAIEPAPRSHRPGGGHSRRASDARCVRRRRQHVCDARSSSSHCSSAPTSSCTAPRSTSAGTPTCSRASRSRTTQRSHEHLRQHRKLHGATPGALEMFLALRGLRTLPLRFERAQRQRPTTRRVPPGTPSGPHRSLPDDGGSRDRRRTGSVP